MRIDGTNSECRDGNDAGRSTTTEATDCGHGPTVSGGTGVSNGITTQTEQWFEPVGGSDVLSDCPGGVCPVPWAKNTIEEKPDTAWDQYLEKHRAIVTDRSDWNKQSSDMVNHPSHYADGGIECIEAIEAQLTPEEYRGFLKGNVAKYVWREKNKGGVESLKKAQWYLDRLVNLE